MASTLDNRLRVLSGAQRRVDLEAGLVSAGDGILGEEHVVRGGLAGNGQTLGLSGANHIEAACGGDVLDVQLGAGEFREHDIAGDLQLLALRRPAEKTQARRGDALVHLALANKVFVLAMAHEHLVKHLAVVHAAAHHAGTLDSTAVIGEGDGSARDHITHLGDDLALKTLAHGARRVNAAMAGFGGASFDIGDNGAVIGNGVGVGHGADAGETARGRSSRLGLDVTLVLKAGLAKVHVHIDETGD